MANNMELDRKPMSLLISIVDRGAGNTLMKRYSDYTLRVNTQCAAEGTASSSMLEDIGVELNEKDILFSLAPTPLIDTIMIEFNNMKLEKKIKSSGIIFSVGLEAINSLLAMVIDETSNFDELSKEQMEEVKYMNQKTSNSLIILAVNQGYTDDLMQVARKAGATGGTIVRGRWSDGGMMEEHHGITLQEEREMVFILASEISKANIMNAINENFGLMKEANGLICAVPVDQAIKF
ncbi:MAG: hypothetical protein ACK5LL_15215 [Suipraeoptans sp.]